MSKAEVLGIDAGDQRNQQEAIKQVEPSRTPWESVELIHDTKSKAREGQVKLGTQPGHEGLTNLTTKTWLVEMSANFTSCVARSPPSPLCLLRWQKTPQKS